MIDRAAVAAHRDINRLLDEARDGTTLGIIYSGPSEKLRGPKPDAPERPPAHLASHAELLPAKPTAAVLASWITTVDECASLRCDLLADRIATAGASPERLMPLLLDLVRARAAAADIAGTASLMGGLTPLFVHLAPLGDARARRAAAAALDTQLSAILDPLIRCGKIDRCPSCRIGEACPLDIWRLGLGFAALGGDLDRLPRHSS